jgi:hypothetical protein
MVIRTQPSQQAVQGWHWRWAEAESDMTDKLEELRIGRINALLGITNLLLHDPLTPLALRSLASYS